MKKCDTCIYRNENEYHKPCIVYRDDCEFYEKERGDMTDDLISRQAVIDGIEELKKSPWATDKRGNGFEYLIAEALDVVADLCVKQASSVNPQEPKTGHWSHDGSHWKNRFICSECGYKLFEEQTNYCPNCGCRMVEPQESEEV